VTQWLPFELHCHTFHSDGKQSLAELASAAKGLGLRGVALTDHNTMTGLLDRDTVVANTGVEIIPGLEWTTFFGHMLTLGITEYVDWRNLSPFHIHRGIEGVHKQGGLVGIAHPFRIGSPMCTGCFWEFEVSDWKQVDYIEVWSGLFPSIRRNNARAFEMWTDLLNKGYRIAATCGRDWHVSDPVTEPISVTYLGIREGNQDLVSAALNALKRGVVAISMGPLPLMSVRSFGGRMAELGDVVEWMMSEPAPVIQVAVDFSAREGLWNLPEQLLKMRLMSNKGELATLELSSEQPHAEYKLNAAGISWVRAELFGTFCGTHTRIGFTNAIYFEEVN
jgi:hypothetical protein